MSEHTERVLSVALIVVVTIGVIIGVVRFTQHVMAAPASLTCEELGGRIEENVTEFVATSSGIFSVDSNRCILPGES